MTWSRSKILNVIIILPSSFSHVLCRYMFWLKKLILALTWVGGIVQLVAWIILWSRVIWCSVISCKACTFKGVLWVQAEHWRLVIEEVGKWNHRHPYSWISFHSVLLLRWGLQVRHRHATMEIVWEDGICHCQHATLVCRPRCQCCIVKSPRQCAQLLWQNVYGSPCSSSTPKALLPIQEAQLRKFSRVILLAERALSDSLSSGRTSSTKSVLVSCLHAKIARFRNKVSQKWCIPVMVLNRNQSIAL